MALSPDPWKNHHTACESHYEGTAAWFIKGDMFSEWKVSGLSSLLWVHGKRELPSGAYALAEVDGFHPRSGVREERTLAC